MNQVSFDGFVRSFAQYQTRRSVIRRGALGALGVALAGVAGVTPAAAAECRGSELRCRRDDQCCSGKCRNRQCKPKDLQVGDACDPDLPSDCVTGVCGCTAIDTKGKPAKCTCRRATCSGTGNADCEETADCCDGFCLRSRGICFPPPQQCIPEGASCSDAPTLCCPGFGCTGGVCVEQL